MNFEKKRYWQNFTFTEAFFVERIVLHMMMRYSWLSFTLCLPLVKVWAKEVDILNNTCFDNVCFPRDYNKSIPPSKNLTVYANIVYKTGENLIRSSLKSIHEHKMRLEFVPRIVMAWEDPRVTLLEKTEMRLDVLLLEFMWTPKITVENRKTKDGSFFDFGKVGEANRGQPMSWFLRITFSSCLRFLYYQY